MKKPLFLQLTSLILFFFFVINSGFAQDCVVDKESIKGVYTGECKKGKAHGIGKSVGTDTYEGSFKSGLPEGKGVYTWNSKNSFTGNFLKGLREGKGVLTYKIQNAADSIVEGFWKKDVYLGIRENPWEVHSRSGSIRSVDVEYSPSKVNRIRVIVTNTTGSVASIGYVIPSYTVTDAVVTKGSYESMTTLETHVKAKETTFLQVVFPFRAKLSLMREELDIEFFESGTYTVNIYIVQ